VEDSGVTAAHLLIIKININMDLQIIGIIAASITVSSAAFWLIRKLIITVRSISNRIDDLEQSFSITQEFKFKEDTLVITTGTGKIIKMQAGDKIIVTSNAEESTTVKGNVFHNQVEVVTDLRHLVQI